MNLNELKSKANICIAMHRAVSSEVVELTSTLETLLEKQKTIKDSILLGKACSKKSIFLADYLAKLNTEALSNLLNQSYEFIYEKVMEKDHVKGLTPKLKAPGGEFDSIASFGDAVFQTCSLITAATLLLFSQSTTSLLLVCDEPFSNINSALSKRAWEYLSSLSEEGNIQMIVITHMSMDCPTKYLVSKSDSGTSSIKKAL